MSPASRGTREVASRGTREVVSFKSLLNWDCMNR